MRSLAFSSNRKGAQMAMDLFRAVEWTFRIIFLITLTCDIFILPAIKIKSFAGALAWALASVACRIWLVRSAVVVVLFTVANATTYIAANNEGEAVYQIIRAVAFSAAIYFFIPGGGTPRERLRRIGRILR